MRHSVHSNNSISININFTITFKINSNINSNININVFKYEFELYFIDGEWVEYESAYASNASQAGEGTVKGVLQDV